MKLSYKYWPYSLLYFVFAVLVVFSFTAVSTAFYEAGKYTGFNEGATAMLDTVNTILEKANRKDKVTHLWLAKPDTVSYFLSAKTINHK